MVIKDENRYNAGRGSHLILKRAEKARSLVNKLPGTLSFIYVDKHYLVQALVRDFYMMDQLGYIIRGHTTCFCLSEFHLLINSYIHCLSSIIEQLSYLLLRIETISFQLLLQNFSLFFCSPLYKALFQPVFIFFYILAVEKKIVPYIYIYI